MCQIPSADIVVGSFARLWHRCVTSIAGPVALQHLLVVVLLRRTVGVTISCRHHLVLLLVVGAHLQEAGHLEAALVGALVELVEQEEEHDGVHADPPDERARVVAVDEEQLEGVYHDGDKLQHLQAGQVLLPPEEPLELGAHGGKQVVRVHDNVHKGVEQAEKGAVAAGRELDAEPHGHGHATVVDDVQSGHLAGLLAEHKEYLE